MLEAAGRPAASATSYGCRRRQRERQRLAVRARAQRVVGADRLAELQRHGVVADRLAIGEQLTGLSEPGPNAVLVCSALRRPHLQRLRQ